MENKTAQPNEKWLSVQEQRKLFATYLDHECRLKDRPKSKPETISIQFLNKFHHHGADFFFSEWSILVKPLARISDEDFKKLGELAGWKSSGFNCRGLDLAIFAWGFDIKITKDKVVFTYGENYHDPCSKKSEHLWAYDFLRERGYALPYKNWSVKELVEFGIYELV